MPTVQAAHDAPHGPPPVSLVPVLSRSGLEVADGALLLLVVVGLARMTREAEGSGRLQSSDRGGRVALVAGAVRVDRRRVGLDDALGAVARRAVEPAVW